MLVFGLKGANVKTARQNAHVKGEWTDKQMEALVELRVKGWGTSLCWPELTTLTALPQFCNMFLQYLPCHAIIYHIIYCMMILLLPTKAYLLW